MGGLHHGATHDQVHDSRETSARNSRYGLVLFAVYFVIYAAFVLLNAFCPAVMEATPIAGVNVAVLYGLGLILVAFLLSLVYGWLCRAPAAESREESPQCFTKLLRRLSSCFCCSWG